MESKTIEGKTIEGKETKTKSTAGIDMSDTPETDLIWKDMNIGNYQPSWWFVAEKMRDHARRLERERDEAREQARQMSESNQVLMADVRFYRNAWEQLKEGAK